MIRELALNEKADCAKAKLLLIIPLSPLAVDLKTLIICSEQSCTKLFSFSVQYMRVITNTNNKKISEYKTKFLKL